MVRVSSKNDTKRKGVYHPYNTRSRSSSHHKTHPPLPQLKDTAFKDKPKDTAFKDKPAAAGGGGGRGRGPAKKVPLSLYNAIQLALSARKVWKKKRDKLSELDLEFYENFVENVANCYKRKKALPRTWKYNPATASTLEPKDNISLLELNAKPMRPYPVSYNVCNPSTELPNVNNVPLKEDETESWLQFKKLDEGNSTPVPSPYHLKFPVSTEHPFVSVIGYFAVNGFNEAFEMFVENGNHNRLRDPTFIECTYLKMSGSYSFYMTIVADEDGFRGIYEAIVDCTNDHGKRTLREFTLTSVKHDKKRRASKSKSSKGVGVWFPDIDHTGMCSRSTINGITYGCYDYVDPSELAE